MISRKFIPIGLLLCFALFVIASENQKVLYEKKSPYNTIIVTEDDQGLRTLWFDKNRGRQSVVKPGYPDHIELPYARVMPVGLAFVERPQRVLLVGLGGGTIPSFLHKHYPHLLIDVVEIDPDVVDVAKKYFGFQETTTMRAYVDDGRRFIEQSRDRYDVIFLDAFGCNGIPYRLTTQEFLQAVRQALLPAGVVVADIWNRNSNPLYDSMVRTYQAVFEEVYMLDVRGAGNEIVIALPRQDRIQRDALARRARRVSKEKEFPFDLGKIVTYGYRYLDVLNSRGRVLTDAGEAK